MWNNNLRKVNATIYPDLVLFHFADFNNTAAVKCLIQIRHNGLRIDCWIYSFPSTFAYYKCTKKIIILYALDLLSLLLFTYFSLIIYTTFFNYDDQKWNFSNGLVCCISTRKWCFSQSDIDSTVLIGILFLFLVLILDFVSISISVLFCKSFC